jgi:hypothetical protein
MIALLLVWEAKASFGLTALTLRQDHNPALPNTVPYLIQKMVRALPCCQEGRNCSHPSLFDCDSEVVFQQITADNNRIQREGSKVTFEQNQQIIRQSKNTTRRK